MTQAYRPATNDADAEKELLNMPSDDPRLNEGAVMEYRAARARGLSVVLSLRRAYSALLEEVQ